MMKMIRSAFLVAAVLAIGLTGRASAADLAQNLPIAGADATPVVGCAEGWHFVHTRSNDERYLPATLTATFEDAGVVTVDGYSNGNGNAVVMYDVLVDPSDTLIAASDTIDNEGRLLLSHVCVPEGASPSPSPTASPEPTESPSATPDPTPSATPEPSVNPTPTPTSSATPTSTQSATRPVATLPPTDTASADTADHSPYTRPLFFLSGIGAAAWLLVMLAKDPYRRRRP